MQLIEQTLARAAHRADGLIDHSIGGRHFPRGSGTLRSLMAIRMVGPCEAPPQAVKLGDRWGLGNQLLELGKRERRRYLRAIQCLLIIRVSEKVFPGLSVTFL